LKKFLKERFPNSSVTKDSREPVWQAGFYDFNVFSAVKAREKLEYMHNNPVRKGLVVNTADWSYGSAKWYLLKRPVGIEIVGLWSIVGLLRSAHG
jgi:putative transposase